jgi:hypothetical protein
MYSHLSPTLNPPRFLNYGCSSWDPQIHSRCSTTLQNGQVKAQLFGLNSLGDMNLVLYIHIFFFLDNLRPPPPAVVKGIRNGKYIF